MNAASAMGGARSPRPGVFRRLMSRLVSSQQTIEDTELQEDVAEAGVNPIGDCPDREPAAVRGTLRTVTIRPRAGTPALEAELYDGSASLTLVWIGRRRIAGIDAGRNLIAWGRICTRDDTRVIYNPRYELLPDDVD